MVVFKNPEVAAKFEACREKDGIIDVPCGKQVNGMTDKSGYHGLLSGITLAAAEKAVKYGANLLKEKAVKTPGYKKAEEPKPE